MTTEPNYIDGKFIVLDVEELSRVLMIPESSVESIFRDARNASALCEEWSVYLFGIDLHLNKNHPNSDGVKVSTDELCSVRCLTENCLDFKPARNTGSGRSCNDEELRSSINRVGVYVIADIRSFPIVRFYEIPAKLVLDAFDAGLLKRSGFTPKRFNQFIEQHGYTMVETDVNR